METSPWNGGALCSLLRSHIILTFLGPSKVCAHLMFPSRCPAHCLVSSSLPIYLYLDFTPPPPSTSHLQAQNSQRRESPTMAVHNTIDQEFPCSLTINVPFPTPRLATVAHKALAVDQELSPLVRRTFSIDSDSPSDAGAGAASVLRVHYKATTNRMLRVAVNGLMESLNLVVEVMEELDVDVLEHNRVSSQ
ncbi:hypothetical protein CCUS01_15257 [Colletotrichum cuscutae]|uniref:Transcription factor pcc1 n=2 Tax=Colletotrichum acutatum species complex TaxID=2707335 RepID=A0AAI9VEK2_9PEZI|nr:hypothetical protein CCUS01_15257 [Colletotrichum cuscutae]